MEKQGNFSVAKMMSGNEVVGILRMGVKEIEIGKWLPVVAVNGKEKQQLPLCDTKGKAISVVEEEVRKIEKAMDDGTGWWPSIEEAAAGTE